MNQVQRNSANRYFSNTSNPNSKKEQKIKEVLSSAVARKRANREIDSLIKMFHHKKSILQLLPAIAARCSKAALEVAIARIEINSHKLSIEDKIYFERFKASLSEKK
jgi:UDP-2,3-diacylglucosamine pyrophosphatase LpxH